MAVDKEANSLSRVYSYYSKFNLCLFSGQSGDEWDGSGRSGDE